MLAETVSQFPGWAVEAHLRALEVPDLDRAQRVAQLVLARHAEEEPSVESLTEILLEAEREYCSP